MQGNNASVKTQPPLPHHRGTFPSPKRCWLFHNVSEAHAGAHAGRWSTIQSLISLNIAAAFEFNFPIDNPSVSNAARTNDVLLAFTPRDEGGLQPSSGRGVYRPWVNHGPTMVDAAIASLNSMLEEE